MKSLYIKNYKNLRELSIDSLARVNLIVGCNNVGKSTLLEAVSIYLANGNVRMAENDFGFQRGMVNVDSPTKGDVEFQPSIVGVITAPCFPGVRWISGMPRLFPWRTE
mgnify:CR=1 FL=1